MGKVVPPEPEVSNALCQCGMMFKEHGLYENHNFVQMESNYISNANLKLDFTYEEVQAERTKYFWKGLALGSTVAFFLTLVTLLLIR